jgi:ubiquinone/menaquinone biosynthesis C-methylase UbiE
MNIQGAYTSSSYTYEGITAELYDLWFDHEPFQDQFFYQKHIQNNGGLALEIGSGTGRLLLNYLQEKLEVHGVEPSTQMIALCQEKARQLGLKPVIYQQMMERLNIQYSYKTIYVPLCALQLIINRAEVIETFRRFYLHLEKGGQLLISLFMPELAPSQERVWRVVRTTLRPTDNSHVVLSEAVQNNHFEQVQTKWLRYEIYKEDRLIDTFLKTMQMRWYQQYAFIMMLERAGFRDVFIYGQYSERSATDGDEALVFSARK